MFAKAVIFLFASVVVAEPAALVVTFDTTPPDGIVLKLDGKTLKPGVPHLTEPIMGPREFELEVTWPEYGKVRKVLLPVKLTPGYGTHLRLTVPRDWT